MKKIISKSIIFILALSVITTGCGNKAKIKNGKTTVVGANGSEISATEYYNSIKKENVSKLVEMIDHKLFDKKYKTDDKENEQVESQIKQIKSNYSNDEETYLNVIKQYFGVNSEDELKDMLHLEYKRNLAVEEHVKESITDNEIKKYYNDNITGDIKASHILIKVNAKDNSSEEEKTKAEEKAKATAEKVIKQLDEGKSFSSLAKKYSNDESNKAKGGDLGYFSADDMDENFMNAVKALENGKYTTEPVKTQYGYHVILRVNQKKKASLKSVENKIREKLATEKLDSDPALHYNALIEIREKNNVKWNDKDLKKAYDDLMKQLIDQTNKNNTTNNNAQ